MGKLVPGDDGLLVEVVGEWVEEKLFDVRTYVEVTSATRAKYLPPKPGGATYVDLFCGPGRGLIKDTRRFVDGTAVAAWKCSVATDTPFTAVYIADKEVARRDLCVRRLRALGAPVHEVEGDALAAARTLRRALPPYGLHFACLDPYSLGALDFEILRSLAALKRMDMLVHLSAMDLWRNIEHQSAEEATEFDAFAPGWRNHVPRDLPQPKRRDLVMKYWAALVTEQLGLDASGHMHPVHNSVNRLLYWLVVLHRHPLAMKFWKVVRDARPQQTREMF